MKKTALIIMIVTIISKVLGFLRDLTLSYFYGASEISDAYLVAMTIPWVIFSFIGVGINNGFIPMYTQIETEENVYEADKFTSNFVGIALIFTMFVFLLGMVFTGPLVKVFASGFNDESLNTAVFFSRITLFGVFFTTLTYIYSGYLNVKNSFIVPAMIGFPLNIVSIIAIAVSSRGNTSFLVIGNLIASMSQFLFLIPSVIKKGFRYQAILDFKDKNIKKTLIIVMPMIIGSSVNQINILVDRTLASRIAVGGISAMNYADKLNGFVQGLFVLSIVTVLYPTISKMAVKKDMDGLKKSVAETISVITIVVVPATVIAMMFSTEIVEILFKRGSFDTDAVIMTSTALFFFAAGMLGFGLRTVLSSVFYSMQDTRTPVINSAIAVLMNIILNIILSKYMGIGGLALATSLSAIISTLLLGYSLIKKIGSLGVKNIVFTFIKSTVASIVMITTVTLLFNFLVGSLATVYSLSVSSFVGLIIYVLVGKIIGIEEIDAGIDFIKRKVYGSGN